MREPATARLTAEDTPAPRRRRPRRDDSPLPSPLLADVERDSMAREVSRLGHGRARVPRRRRDVHRPGAAWVRSHEMVGERKTQGAPSRERHGGRRVRRAARRRRGRDARALARSPEAPGGHRCQRRAPRSRDRADDRGRRGALGSVGDPRRRSSPAAPRAARWVSGASRWCTESVAPGRDGTSRYPVPGSGR